MKVVKLCISTWENESRDKRELSVVRELDVEAEVIAKNPDGGKGWSICETMVDGYPVTQLSTRPLGKRFPTGLNRIAATFTWVAYIRKRSDADAFSCHDIGALTIGYLSQIGKRRKAKLVYDSHEFEIGRSAERNKLQIWGITHLERFLIKRCAFAIMVNDSIADEVQRVHKLKQRPIVARNIPPYWTLDDNKIQAVRHSYLGKLNAPEDVFIAMYHGAVMPFRGIEVLLQAVSRLSGVCAVILGNGSEDYLASLKALCAELNISDRVLFHPAVPIEILRNYVGASDVGVMSGDKSVIDLPNSVYSLPNKFFENIQSLTPVISNRPETTRITEQYQIGLSAPPGDDVALSEEIEKLRDDKEFYQSCKRNLERAKKDLCWENEKSALAKAYQKNFKSTPPPQYKYLLKIGQSQEIVIETRFVSYYLSLPNKFFENIQSLTPVIVGRGPEMLRLVAEYQIGESVPSGDAEILSAAIARMRDDKEFYQSCKRNLERAKKDLCWENEKMKLKNAYQEILK